MTDLIDNQDDVPTCRICHCTESPGDGLVKLISPCHCSGSLRYVHHGCLQRWLDATNSQRCELCRHPFSISIKYKPLYKWSAINASPSERRKLICNSVFNLVSMICIFWSIYVLIEKAALDARAGNIDWNFYVKISVVTIGLIIGVIFLFVQLKLYFSIFMKWRLSNRIINIRDANFSNTPTTATTTISSAPQVIAVPVDLGQPATSTPPPPQATAPITTRPPTTTSANKQITTATIDVVPTQEHSQAKNSRDSSSCHGVVCA